MKYRHFLFLVTPSLLIIVLFISVKYFIAYPSLNKALIDEEKHDAKTIALLAKNIISEHIANCKKDKLNIEQTQQLALKELSNVNIDQNNLNCLWVIDTYPQMIMHPYRKDLEGKNIANFTGPDGKKIFLEALEATKDNGEGYLEYLWENDKGETNLILSYVVKIDTLDWILGANILKNNPNSIILKLKRKIDRISFFFLITMVLLTAIILFNSLKNEEKRKKVKEKLATSEEKFRNLFHNSNDIIIISNLEGAIIDVNDKALKKYAVEKKDLLGKKTLDFIPAHYHQIIIDRLSKVKHHELKPVEIEFTIDGTNTFDVEINTSIFNYMNSFAILTIARDLSDRKQLEKQLMNAIITGEENERMRLAKDLHDGLGPFLSTIKLYFQWLSETNDPKKRDLIIDKGNKNINEAISVLKEISNNLSPHILINYGLMEAIKEFIVKFEGSQFCSINFSPLADIRLSAHVETTLYRIVIELINNTLKHARASKIDIKFSKPDDHKLLFLYADNGIGFNLSEILKSSHGLGLVNIKNRIETISGKVKFNTSPKNGFSIQCTINLD